MAKTSVVNRDLKRRQAVKKYAAKRKALLELASSRCSLGINLNVRTF